MYEEHFGLNRRPFATVTHSDDFVGIAPLQEALDSLLYCISQSRGIGVITSAPGMGKTLLCRRVASLLHQQVFPIYLSTSSFQTRRALLQAILFELGVDYLGLTEQEARLALLESARHHHALGRNLLLIVDEAHLLPPRLFEELRSLTDYSTDGSTLIQLILCGQFALEEILADPSLSAFNQRIGAQVCLEALTQQQSAQFLIERLKHAGLSNPLTVLTEEAIQTICQASDGNLRCLTQLSDHTFLIAFQDESNTVTEEHVRKALDDLKELPLQWNDVSVDSRLNESITQDDVPLAPDWDAAVDDTHDQNLPPVSTNDYETDEFQIPEAFRKLMALNDQFASPTSSESLAEQAQAAMASTTETPAAESPTTEAPAIEYAVIEVGPETEEDPINLTAQPKVTTEEEAVIESSASTSADDVSTIGTSSQGQSTSSWTDHSTTGHFSEMVVHDRYAQLDRLLELPPSRRGTVNIPSHEESALENKYPYLTQSGHHDIREGIAAPGSASPISVSEEVLLDTIRHIRREILDTVDHSRRFTEVTLPEELQQPWSPKHDSRKYDVVEPAEESASAAEQLQQPASQSESIAAQPAVEKTEKANEGRFAQLFSRLRERRNRAANRQLRSH